VKHSQQILSQIFLYRKDYDKNAEESTAIPVTRRFGVLSFASRAGVQGSTSSTTTECTCWNTTEYKRATRDYGHVLDQQSTRLRSKQMYCNGSVGSSHLPPDKFKTFSRYAKHPSLLAYEKAPRYTEPPEVTARTRQHSDSRSRAGVMMHDSHAQNGSDWPGPSRGFYHVYARTSLTRGVKRCLVSQQCSLTAS
jgi:hypothetical protein